MLSQFLIFYLIINLSVLGAILSLVSGIPSLPNNPGFVFNVAVFILLGYEALPKKESTRPSDYNSLSGAIHGIVYNRNVKILFGMSIWWLFSGNNEAFIGAAIFDIGVWISIIGSEIEKRTIKKILNKMKKH